MWQKPYQYKNAFLGAKVPTKEVLQCDEVCYRGYSWTPELEVTPCPKKPAKIHTPTHIICSIPVFQRPLHEHRWYFQRDSISKHWKIYMHTWLLLLKRCQEKNELEERWKTNKPEHPCDKYQKLLTHLLDDNTNNENVSALIWWLRPLRAPF